MLKNGERKAVKKPNVKDRMEDEWICAMLPKLEGACKSDAGSETATGSRRGSEVRTELNPERLAERQGGGKSRQDKAAFAGR